MRHVLVRTFGCKLNQYDSQLITESFARSGYAVANDPSSADVCVINTCSVTARSDHEARQFVRRILRSKRRPFVVVTGCYSQRAPEEIASIEGVGLVTGNVEKASLPRLLDGLYCGEGAATVTSPLGRGPCLAGCDPAFQRRARAIVKIQDGCDSSCTYCVVPSVRGGARSVSPARVLSEVISVCEIGYREVVLTGARVGSYGCGSGNGQSLEALVRLLVDARNDFRVRVSSLEPDEITQSLLGLSALQDRVCAHFHVPLQSGDDSILRAMARPYSSSEYGDKVVAIKRALPNACVGADVIVGFPGETDAQFARTYELVESLPLAYLHVFPYSGRPGTPASHMPGQISGAVKKARARALIELGAGKRREFAVSQAGTVETAILEESAGQDVWKATTGNYLRVLVRGGGRSTGEAVRVRIGALENDRLRAEAF
jgi:threonylcarbamoyladenosine tRNA methylthiotransferase MtaB